MKGKSQANFFQGFAVFIACTGDTAPPRQRIGNPPFLGHTRRHHATHGICPMHSIFHTPPYSAAEKTTHASA
jgi:hypothetical protein